MGQKVTKGDLLSLNDSISVRRRRGLDTAGQRVFGGCDVTPTRELGQDFACRS